MEGLICETSGTNFEHRSCRNVGDEYVGSRALHSDWLAMRSLRGVGHNTCRLLTRMYASGAMLGLVRHSICLASVYVATVRVHNLSITASHTEVLRNGSSGSREASDKSDRVFLPAAIRST